MLPEPPRDGVLVDTANNVNVNVNVIAVGGRASGRMLCTDTSGDAGDALVCPFYAPRPVSLRPCLVLSVRRAPYLPS